MAATYHTGNGNNVLRGWRLRRDSKGYPIRFHFLYTTPDFDLTLRTLPDVGRLPRHKMAAIETGSGNNYWTKWLDPMPTHTRASILTSLRYYRRWLTTDIHGGGHHFRFQWSHEILSAVSSLPLGRAWSKMWEPLKSRRHLFPFKSYFYFRFPACHFEFRQSPSSASMSDVRTVKGDDRPIAPWPDANTRCTCYKNSALHGSNRIASIFRASTCLSEFHFRSRGMRLRNGINCATWRIVFPKNTFWSHG